MQSFVKVFNDVFVKEKPQVCHKYFLSEVRILEMDTRDEFCHQMHEGFRWNFAHGTTKEIDYLKSPYMRAFIETCLKSVIAREGKDILNFTPRKKEEDRNPFQIRGMQKVEMPNNGREFFFSNVLVKIYQVPVIFISNSEEEYSKHESSFIVLFYEKNMRKRTFAKSQSQKQRVQRIQEIKKFCSMHT